MSTTTSTSGRESGTGQDTPLGVCPCPAPPTPCATWRDIVPSCPVVPRTPLMESKATATRFFWRHAAGACRASLVLGVLNRYREAAMSERRSRSKGARIERGIVNALQAYGVAAVRVPLSGAVGGRFAGDIVLPLMGRDLCVEVKARADGFRELYCWLDQRDVLIVKADRQEPLVILRLSLAMQIVKAGSGTNMGLR
jgi:Holliday junction resolvase